MEIELRICDVLMPLLAQQSAESADVKYIVAIIAAVASVIAAIVAAAAAITVQIIYRVNQRALNQQQADLARLNQSALNQQQADLTRLNQTALNQQQAELTRLNQVELAKLNAVIGDQIKDRDARREYEYEAHKKLYAECEPLLFQLAELSEHAFFRIKSLARTARHGNLPKWLDHDGYYMRSTIYKLIAPLVIFRLMQQHLTFVDLTLDKHIRDQYRLLKAVYLTFTDPFKFAEIDEKLEYKPDIDDWETKRQQDQGKYWRQGLHLGALDNSIDALLLPDQPMQWKTFGQFETEFLDKESQTFKQFSTLLDVFQGFHPSQRPVLWRMLRAQNMIYEKIFEKQNSTPGKENRLALPDISPTIPFESLDWRQPGEAQSISEDAALGAPGRAARAYLHERLPDLF